MTQGFPLGLVLEDGVHVCYTCVLMLQWGSLLRFSVLRGELFSCQPCTVSVGVAVLVDPPLEVAQGRLLEYTLLDMALGAATLAEMHLEVAAISELQTC